MSPFKFGRKLAHEIHEIDVEGVALHPDQHRRVLIVGILVGALSLGIGVSLIGKNGAAQKDLLQKVGAHPVSAGELSTVISRLKITWKPYWLGAMTGFQYASDTSESDEILIRYLGPSGDPSINGENLYTVESYENEATYNHDVISQDFATDTEIVSNGRTIRYSSVMKAFMSVRIAGNPQVFEIHCSRSQTVAQLEQLAADLTPVV
jgi:hypothetical protein